MFNCLFAFLFHVILTTVSPKCIIEKKESSIVTYWINLGRSAKRRHYMENQLSDLGIHSHRIRAVTPAEFDIPTDVAVPTRCNMEAKSDVYKKLGEFTKRPNISNRRILITGLCGRKKNILTELAVTASHLTAIHTAVYSSNNSPYALIAEDDITIAFDIDFDALIATAPKDFKILQLFTSNDRLVENIWNKYTENTNTLWIHRRNHNDIYDYWCAGAYIINKKTIKPILDQIMGILPDNRITMKIIAAFQFHKSKQCVPEACCHTNGTFRTDSACILSPKGYSADHYIYSFGDAYILTTPLITSGKLGNKSTLHQEHVDMHSKAFARIRDLIKDFRNGQTKLPNFASNFVSC
eukprot:gene11352-23759_t